MAKSLFIKPTRILIADVIGLGKTVTALRILKTIEHYKNQKLGRVLIAVPAVLVEQWKDEMRSMGINPILIERKSLDFRAKQPELPSGWYIGSIDTLKRPEYMAFLQRNKWDAIVVDEAHKLGVVGGEPNMRWRNLGKLIMENRDAIVLLLSATPHRGKANDYLSRLALVDPTLLDVTSVSTLEKVFDKPEFYQRTHNVILFRRNKDDVNKIYERAEIFKPCNMLAVLIEPNDVERGFLRTITELTTSYLRSYYTYIVKELGWKTGRAQSIVALLRTLLVKRGLSSPQALVKTFGKLVEKRGRFIELIDRGYTPDEAQKKIAEEIEDYARKLDEILSGDIGEIDEELDEEFERLAIYFDKLLDDMFREELKKAQKYAEDILVGKAVDSKVETLKKILGLVLYTPPEELPDEFKDLASQKAIVFTEFKDTATYLYEKLRKWAEDEFGDPGIVRVFTSENRGEIEDIKRWLSEDGRRVLVTTDVAGEGLNLQYANVIINYEITWSPIRLEQRIGRVWRYGQDKTTYVFNLFLADGLEKEVAETVFAKLYGISISVGKLEPILGEQVFLSTIRNELLEHAVEERETIGGLIPIEINFENRKISLSEARIIELVAKDARAFVKAFIKALKRLVREIKYKRIFPVRADAEKVREELLHLTGFRDMEDVVETLKNAGEAFSKILDLSFEEREDKILLRSKDGTVFELPISNPETFLKRLQAYFRTDDHAKYFVYQSSEKEVMLLSEVEVLIGGEIRYREPIGILANVETYSLTILRGKELFSKLLKILDNSVPVDEVYGLDDVLNLIPQIMSSSPNTFYETALKNGAVKLIKMLEEYEEVKEKLGAKKFFHTYEPQVKIREPTFIMISSANLPEVKDVPSEEVWGWAEDEAISTVLDYEKQEDREPTRVSGHEHYDVRSVKRGEDGSIKEERFIEVKTKIKRSLNFGLKSEEFKVAEKKGDNYWLYIVYGVRTEKPVILCIKNPAERIPFRRKVSIEKREEYYFGAGGPI
ncbi:protein NO VEIN domain-containing protein [Aeropyrum pernix]|uniref:protein NO VEIN domain-containing protein n=1 Tax=Aeropyrum pernix TaxID=56636 RepID=UPI00130524C8|nr:DUF3883 domain-containing protein [Aeropyrum pernix]